MSVFESTALACPSCGAPVDFELVHSVNAVRRPDLREAILARSFQREECAACGFVFRMEPEFTYLDVGRKQFIAVWPAAMLAQWQAREQRAQAAFDRAFGPASDAHRLGASLAARAVFGWPGLNEKLLAAESGIDDRTLELAKLALLRSGSEVRAGTGRELRLVGVSAEHLVFVWLRAGTDEAEDEFSVPRALLAEIEAEPGDWQALREQVAGPMFVDYRRALLAE